MEHILRFDENKTELFGFLADKIAGMICETAIFVTKDEHVLTNNEGDVSHFPLQPRRSRQSNISSC
jgi:hypothetical protein